MEQVLKLMYKSESYIWRRKRRTRKKNEKKDWKYLNKLPTKCLSVSFRCYIVSLVRFAFLVILCVCVCDGLVNWHHLGIILHRVEIVSTCLFQCEQAWRSKWSHQTIFYYNTRNEYKQKHTHKYNLHYLNQFPQWHFEWIPLYLFYWMERNGTWTIERKYIFKMKNKKKEKTRTFSFEFPKLYISTKNSIRFCSLG